MQRRCIPSMHSPACILHPENKPVHLLPRCRFHSEHARLQVCGGKPKLLFNRILEVLPIPERLPRKMVPPSGPQYGWGQIPNMLESIGPKVPQARVEGPNGLLYLPPERPQIGRLRQRLCCQRANQGQQGLAVLGPQVARQLRKIAGWLAWRWWRRCWCNRRCYWRCRG